MTAALAHAVVDDEPELLVDPPQVCRFCGCTEDSPCVIRVREDAAGEFHLATEAEATWAIACAWFLPNICTSPGCIAKLIDEQRVLLFDAHGRPAA